MDRHDVEEILERHTRWRSNVQEGRGATFERVDLRGFDFAGRDLSLVQFVGCDLRGARLRDCDLSFAEFICCDLREADLRGAEASGVYFHGSDLRAADLRGLSVEVGGDFVAADLRGARLEGMRLRNSDLRGAWVAAADVRGASFEETLSPSGASLDGTVDPDTDRADLTAKLQRTAAHPEAVNPPLVAAYELGSGRALLDRLLVAWGRQAHDLAGQSQPDLLRGLVRELQDTLKGRYGAGSVSIFDLLPDASPSHEAAARTAEPDRAEQGGQEQTPRPPRRHER